jgi:hypothetical protein
MHEVSKYKPLQQAFSTGASQLCHRLEREAENLLI